MIGKITDGVAQVGRAIGDAVNSKRNAHRSAEAQAAYEENQQNYYSGFKDLDANPVFANDMIATRKRSESPVARAYLDSLLTGDNVDAASSPWANKSDVDATSASRNKRYGSLDALMAQDKAVKAETPWSVTNETDPMLRNDPKSSSASGWTYEGMDGRTYDSATHQPIERIDPNKRR